MIYWDGYRALSTVRVQYEHWFGVRGINLIKLFDFCRLNFKTQSLIPFLERDPHTLKCGRGITLEHSTWAADSLKLDLPAAESSHLQLALHSHHLASTRVLYSRIRKILLPFRVPLAFGNALPTHLLLFSRTNYDKSLHVLRNISKRVIKKTPAGLLWIGIAPGVQGRVRTLWTRMYW